VEGTTKKFFPALRARHVPH